MKKIIAIVCASIFCVSTFTASAQDDLKIIQTIFGQDKKDLITSYMDNLPADKSAKFWELYDKYEQARQEIVRDHLIEFAKITQKASDLDDKTAAAYGKERGRYETKRDKLHKKYFCKLNSAVGGYQALKFMQVEGYIEDLVQIQLQSKMPFIGEIETLIPKN